MTTNKPINWWAKGTIQLDPRCTICKKTQQELKGKTFGVLAFPGQFACQECSNKRTSQ